VREYLSYIGWKESDLKGIIFTGFISHEDMPMLYNCADILLLPSFYEGCPSTLLEAMACGCAIIASQAGPFAELTNGAVLLADPYDPSDFAAKIIMIMNNKDLKKELREKSVKRGEFFNWEHTAGLILEELTQVVKHSHN
jgi:glycosyltransferase involved in cell wall biosynthesis